jgi:hypothetical protein
VSEFTVPANPYKTEDGQYYTQGLFLETSYEDLSRVLYTLKRADHMHKGVLYRSFPRLYLEIADPTEYQVATTLFDGWPHWVRLQGNSRIFPTIQALRDELEVKLRSDGIRRLISMKQSESAAKWLADKGWEKREMGRPTKEKVQKEAKKLQGIKEEIERDATRITGLSRN